MSTSQLRREIKRVVDRMPAKRLASLADYVQFLCRPPLRQRILTGKRAIALGKGVQWRQVRRDV
jgi:hypothetical protein